MTLAEFILEHPNRITNYGLILSCYRIADALTRPAVPDDKKQMLFPFMEEKP